MTNALGYYENTRNEGQVDPNRDYPIDQDPTLCMQAVTSRVVNELFRTYMFQIAITFHAGMEAIAMEWGTMSRKDRVLHKSPDDFALLQIGGALSFYAGSVIPDGRNYPVGRMNDLVYPVPGGMEDWAYAGNWDPLSKREPCKPTTFGGYELSKTQYTAAMLRAVNILVETSDLKSPLDMGHGRDLLNPNGGQGHVARNVRLALLTTELVEPYIHVWVDDPRPQNASFFTPAGRLLLNEPSWVATIRWEVGGVFRVDETRVRIETVDKRIVFESPSFSGDTRWTTRTYSDRGKYPFKAQFGVCVNLGKPSTYAATVGSVTTLIVIVEAKVDSTWTMQGKRIDVSPPNFPPQTHLVNARTNPVWKMENAGKKIQGKVFWEQRARLVLDGTKFLSLGGRRLRSTKEQAAAATVYPDDLPSDKFFQDCRFVLQFNSTDMDIDNDPYAEQTTRAPHSPDIVREGQYSIGHSLFFSSLAFITFLVFTIYMWRTKKRRNGSHHVLVETDGMDDFSQHERAAASNSQEEDDRGDRKRIVEN